MPPTVKSALVGVACALLSPGPARADEGGTRFALGVGFVVPTLLSVDGETSTAEPGPLVLISFDRAVSESLDAGGFLDVGSFSAEDSDEQVNLMQIGGLLYWRRADTWGGLLRLGGRLGYRQLFADARGYDAVRGIAADLVAQWIGQVSRNLTGSLELGVLTEPFGANEHGTVFFGPFPYLALGVIL